MKLWHKLLLGYLAIGAYFAWKNYRNSAASGVSAIWNAALRVIAWPALLNQ